MSWGSAVEDRARDQSLDMAAGSGDGTGPGCEGLIRAPFDWCGAFAAEHLQYPGQHPHTEM